MINSDKCKRSYDNLYLGVAFLNTGYTAKCVVVELWKRDPRLDYLQTALKHLHQFRPFWNTQEMTNVQL